MVLGVVVVVKSCRGGGEVQKSFKCGNRVEGGAGGVCNNVPSFKQETVIKLFIY